MIGSWWIRIRRGVGRLVSGQSLQWRLALLTGISVALSVVVVGATSYVVTRWSLLEQLDRELVGVAQTASGAISSNVSNMGGLSADLLGSSNGLLALVAADGLVKQVPGQPLALPAGSEEIAVARMQTGSSARTLDADGTTYRVVSVPMTVDGAFYAVMYGRPTVALESTLSSLWLSLLAAGALGVMTTTLAALWAAQAVLAPVRRLSQAVKSVTQTDQLNPIRIYGRDDLGELTKSFNLMLRSLQTSREQQRQLIADAGHELRTPLTSMRTNIELLLADDTSGMLPEGAGSGGWVKSPTTSGEVWLKVQLDKDTKYLGSYLSAVGGVSDPVTLAEEDRETPYDYYFHLATIDGNKVVQHQAGTVYLQIHPGTFGPSGKS